jgi:hypothetical protein
LTTRRRDRLIKQTDWSAESFTGVDAGRFRADVPGGSRTDPARVRSPAATDYMYSNAHPVFDRGELPKHGPGYFTGAGK